ncbi:hypothetical protein [Pseudomonas sp. L-22-4S-12]|nr:hypothetical protein [Pseudomonas sp. L-22-4S-12]
MRRAPGQPQGAEGLALLKDGEQLPVATPKPPGNHCYTAWD